MPEVEPRLTIAPPPCASITGSTCLQVRNTLLRLESICASQTSSVISTGPPWAEPPTLLTSTSMRPNRLTQAATVAACDKRFGRIDVLVNIVGGSAHGGPPTLLTSTSMRPNRLTQAA